MDAMRLQVPTDFLILEDLIEHRGKDLTANIADRIDRHRGTLAPRMKQLVDYGLLEDCGRGVYAITRAGEIAYQIQSEYSHDKATEFENLLNDKLQE